MIYSLLLLAGLTAGWLLFVLVRLGVHQRLSLVLGRISLEQILDRAAARHGDRPLFTCDRAADWAVPALAHRYPDPLAWTATRIRDSAGFVAAAVRNLGIRDGDRVAILKGNHFDIHVLTAGVVRAGGIACPMSGRFAGDKLRPYLDNVGARVLITDPATLDRVLAEGGDVGSIETVVFAAHRERECPTQAAMLTRVRRNAPQVRVAWIETLLAAVTQPIAPRPRGATDPVYLVHTSGTTGFPKAVILTNGRQSHAVRGWLAYVHLSRTRDRAMLAVPNNHQAVILTFNSALLLGLPLHWVSGSTRDDLDAEALAAELARGRYTGFFAFPIVYTLLKEVDWRQHDVHRMRFWAATADASHAAIERVFLRLGSAFRSLGLPLGGSIFLDAQGSSEVGTPSVIRYLTPFTRAFDRRIGRPGSTPFGPHLRITGRDGRPVRAGEAGRLEVRGRTVFCGYWNNHAMTHAAIHDDWFFTGDIARMDRDGHVVQLDREVDVIRTANGPVYSLLIEERLHTHAAVFDVCVYGARQDNGTQLPAATVALRAGVRTDARTLLRDFNTLLGRHEQLANVDLMPWTDFPIGVTGKTLKRVFRERTERVTLPEANRPLAFAGAGAEP